MKTVNDPSKPNNRICINYCNAIVNTYAGYMTGIDITYNSNEDITQIQDILNYNDVATEDAEFLKDLLVYGVAMEVNWIDPDGKQRFKVLDPRECIPVYENTLEEELAAVIRFYAVSQNTMLDDKNYYVEVYDARETAIYKTDATFTTYELLDLIPNFYGMVPVSVAYMDKDHKNIFDQIISAQDAYNQLISSETDDFQSFVDAYLKLTGIDDIDEETLKNMRTNRVLVLPEGGNAEFLNKNISDTQIENMLDNLRASIREISCAPDFTDEAFGASSGISLKFKLLNFENKAGQIEKSMKKALQRRIELICSILSLTSGEEL